jgi:hypothetical protein
MSSIAHVRLWAHPRHPGAPLGASGNSRIIDRPRGVTGRRDGAGCDEIAHFVAVARKYGYNLGTPEQNAALGIEAPDFTANE